MSLVPTTVLIQLTFLQFSLLPVLCCWQHPLSNKGRRNPSELLSLSAWPEDTNSAFGQYPNTHQPLYHALVSIEQKPEHTAWPEAVASCEQFLISANKGAQKVITPRQVPINQTGYGLCTQEKHLWESILCQLALKFFETYISLKYIYIYPWQATLPEKSKALHRSAISVLD